MFDTIAGGLIVAGVVAWCAGLHRQDDRAKWALQLLDYLAPRALWAAAFFWLGAGYAASGFLPAINWRSWALFILAVCGLRLLLAFFAAEKIEDAADENAVDAAEEDAD